MSIEIPERELGEMQTADKRVEMHQQITAAKTAIETMERGIQTRKELIQKYEAKLKNDGTNVAPEGSNFRALSNDEVNHYSTIITEQIGVIEEYEKTRTDFIKIIDKLELQLSKEETIGSLADLEERFGQEFHDHQQNRPQSFEIHVDRPNDEI